MKFSMVFQCVCMLPVCIYVYHVYVCVWYMCYMQSMWYMWGIHVYMVHTCMCTVVWVLSYAYLWMDAILEGGYQVSCSNPLCLIPLEQGLLLNLEVTSLLLECLASLILLSLYSPYSAQGLQLHHVQLFLNLGVGDLNSGPQAHTANMVTHTDISPASESSFQLHFLIVPRT